MITLKLHGDTVWARNDAEGEIEFHQLSIQAIIDLGSLFVAKGKDLLEEHRQLVATEIDHVR